jgi:hypothetical protein
MSKLLSSRASVAVAAALFALATWFGSTHHLKSAPTSLVLSQPAPQTNQMIAATSGARM